MIDKLMSLLVGLFISLFSFIPSNINQPPDNSISILFTGDVMLGRSVMGESIDKFDFIYPFENVKLFLSDADITFVNLENAIIPNCPRSGRGSFTFCTTPNIAEGLKLSGVDIVTLANNHSGNYGEEGLLETKDFLNKMGIKWVDGTNCEIIEKNDTKFAFVGLNFIFRDLDKNDLDLIVSCKKQSDILFVSPHWGEEYKSIANNTQKEYANKILDAGADIIVGHHPHWVQDYQEIDGKPVYYSLGNFIFDQMWSEETKKGLAVKFTFDEGTLTKREEFKVYIEKVGQPRIIIE